MRILTLDNQAFEMTKIPDEVEDMRFCILDNSDPKDPDYFFIPLIFLESFNAPALVLRIGDSIVKMPVDWQILIGEPDLGDLEVVPMTSINDRGFSAYTFNPLHSFKPEFFTIDIIDIYQDVKWYFPKLKPGQLLAVPIEEGDRPRCAYFVKDISRQSEVIDYGKDMVGKINPELITDDMMYEGALSTQQVTDLYVQHMKEEEFWKNLRASARTNPTLQAALDQCIMIYKLSKEYKNGI